MERRYLKKPWQRALYYRLRGDRIFSRFLADNANSISGHTVIGIYLRTSGRDARERRELASIGSFFANSLGLASGAVSIGERIEQIDGDLS
jgi:hypothetical protein